MDGVLWRDTEPIGNLPDIFEQIVASGLKFILATNNATRTITAYHEKLLGFGVKLDDWQIINSAQATGIFLQEKYPSEASVFVVGQPSLEATLKSYGLQIADESVNNVDVVVAGLDFTLSYEKLCHASLLIQSGSYFVGTNPDVSLPTPEGFIPGAGTVIGALEIASGIKAKIIGKPEPGLYQMALKRLQLQADQTLAIGDRLETDIAGAQKAGIHSALVLSGASSLEQAIAYSPAPDIMAQDLTALVF